MLPNNINILLNKRKLKLKGNCINLFYLGVIDITITFATSDTQVITGSFMSELNDLSQCDNTLFVCEIGSCSGVWNLVSQSGSNYEFKETVTGGDCAGEADVSLSLVSDNRLSGSVSFDIDPSDVVEIETNPIELSRQ